MKYKISFKCLGQKGGTLLEQSIENTGSVLISNLAVVLFSSALLVKFIFQH